MAFICASCGAQYEYEDTCQQRFDRCLAFEFENREAWSVHHLTVLSFMIQHHQYSKEAWMAASRMLSDFILKEVTPQIMVSVTRSEFENSNRKWRVKQADKHPVFTNLHWTTTIASVRLNDSQTYCSDMKAWAANIVLDIERYDNRLNFH